MVLRPRESLRKLSAWFGHTRLEDPASNLLIWVLLAPATLEDRSRSQYHCFAQELVDEIRMQAGVQRITYLNNVGLGAAMTARSSPQSLLVHVERGVHAAVLSRMQTLLRSGIATDSRIASAALNWRLSTYEPVQTFEPRCSRAISGSCVVTVAIEPGHDQGAEIDDWYREEQLPLLGATSPALFLRCRRYRKRYNSFAPDHSAHKGPSELLAVHEYVSVNTLFQHSINKGPVVEETSWSKDVLSNAKKVERTVWEVL